MAVMHLGWVDTDLGISPGWWAASLPTDCPCRTMQYPISNSTQPTGIATLVDSLGLLFGGCSPKVVEGDSEPLVDLCVDGVVLVDDLPRRDALLQRLRLRLRPVLVRPADVQRVVAPQATEPGKGIQFGDGLRNRRILLPHCIGSL